MDTYAKWLTLDELTCHVKRIKAYGTGQRSETPASRIGIVNRYDNVIFSGDMLRLQADGSVNPHYFLLTLGRHLGQVQCNRWMTCSTIGHLVPRDAGRVLVPRLAPEKEMQTAALGAASLEKRQESEQLLDQAESRVEQLMEEAVRA